MARRAIVVAVEGLGCNMLGAYGGSAETPNLNTSSIRSLTCDQFWLDSIRLESLYRSMWFGWHAAEHPMNREISLAELASQLSLDSMLVTDQPELLEFEGVEDFQDVIQVSLNAEGAEDEPQTAMEQLFETALGSWVAREDCPSLLWIHSRGWRGPWDAPYDWRDELRGDDDPMPPRGTEPPELDLEGDSDPDIVLGWSQAAAAQARALDDAWGWLLSTIENDANPEELLVILVGLQGYPLGEHKTIGLHRETLHAERVHCPLILWQCQSQLGRRSNELTQPADLWRTVADWIQMPIDRQTARRCSQNLLNLQNQNQSRRWAPRNQFAYAEHAGTWMLRTPSWCALHSGSPALEDAGVESNMKLYVHPEDRWQRNDVARRASDIAVAMCELQPTVARWYTSTSDDELLPRIPDSLIDAPA